MLRERKRYPCRIYVSRRFVCSLRVLLCQATKSVIFDSQPNVQVSRNDYLSRGLGDLILKPIEKSCNTYLAAYWLIGLFRLLHASVDEIICVPAKGFSLERFRKLILCLCNLFFNFHSKLYQYHRSEGTVFLEGVRAKKDNFG